MKFFIHTGLVLMLFLCSGGFSHAQSGAYPDDTAPSNVVQKKKVKDTLKSVAAWEPIPKKAGLYAALLPGLGQAYNRQYWKIPVVYVGLSVAGYFLVYNTKEYNRYRKAYIGRIGNPYPTDEFVGILNESQLKQYQDDKNKTLNMTILFSSLGYAVQVLDAITSAHLRNFDISRDISLRMKPVVLPQGVGMGMVMNF